MMPTLTDAPFWKRSQFYLGLITILTLLALQLPEWAPGFKVAIQLLQILATMFAIDQTTRSISLREAARQLSGLDIGFAERDGSPVPADKLT